VGLAQGKTVAVLGIGFALAFPAAAPAAETIGQVGDVSTGNCTNDEAYLQKTLISGTGYSPSAYGVITSWSAMSKATANQTVKLMVFRDDGSEQFSVVARDSVTRTLSSVDDTLNTFTGTRIPIEANQRIGIYQPASSTEGCEFDGVSGDEAGYSVPFGVGEPPDNVPFDYSGSDTGNRVNALAVVEPDADRDVFGDESQDKCLGTPGSANGCPSTVTINKLKQKGETKVKATATVPGAGTLTVGSASDPALASAAAKKGLKAVTHTLTATTKGTVTLTLKLTKSAITKLSDTGKLKLKVKAVYTPPGGSPGSAVKKKTLRG
jgi:hypothetical protein